MHQCDRTLVAYANMPSYVMTKDAVNVFIRNLAAELAPRSITVNSVAPGVIGTDMSSFAKSEQGRAIVLSMQALKRIAHFDDTADVVAFLTSDASRLVTGKIVEASGGSKL